jgi:hypothetical protein
MTTESVFRPRGGSWLASPGEGLVSVPRVGGRDHGRVQRGRACLDDGGGLIQEQPKENHVSTRRIWFYTSLSKDRYKTNNARAIACIHSLSPTASTNRKSLKCESTLTSLLKQHTLKKEIGTHPHQ